MREQDSRSHPVREDMGFQYAFWAWERAMWVVMVLVIMLALSGVLARGALSQKTVTEPGQRLSLTYERFQRITAVSRYIGKYPRRTSAKPACDWARHSTTISKSPISSRDPSAAVPARAASSWSFCRRRRANSRS